MKPSIPPVLYVEDEDNDALLLKFAFKRAGLAYPLRVVTDGRQAVDYLWGNEPFADRSASPFPRIVLLDLNLPQLDGFSVLQRIREESRFKELPVLIFTSSQQASDRSRARELGASDYVVKPSNVERLVAFSQALKEHWLEGD